MKISTLGQTTKRHNIRYIGYMCPSAVSDLRAFRKRVKMLGRMRKWFVVGRRIIAPLWENVCCFACLLPTTSSSQRSASEEEGAN